MKQKYCMYKDVRVSEDIEITKFIIFAHMHQDERLLVFFLCPYPCSQYSPFLDIKYTILVIVIHYKLQMDHPVTSKSCRIAYFNFSSRWFSNFRAPAAAKLLK
jgi:hypothetical protein